MLHRLEAKLPGRTTLDIALTFRHGFQPKLDELDKRAEARGCRVLRDSLTITFADNQPLWKFGAVALERSRAASLALLAEELARSDGVASFSIAPVRN